MTKVGHHILLCSSTWQLAIVSRLGPLVSTPSLSNKSRSTSGTEGKRLNCSETLMVALGMRLFCTCLEIRRAKLQHAQFCRTIRCRCHSHGPKLPQCETTKKETSRQNMKSSTNLASYRTAELCSNDNAEYIVPKVRSQNMCPFSASTWPSVI